MNNESLQKNVEKLLKKKIVEGCIQEDMFEQYINGIKDLSNVWWLPDFTLHYQQYYSSRGLF